MSLYTLYQQWNRKRKELHAKGAAFDAYYQALKTIYQDELPIVHWPETSQIEPTNIGKALLEQTRKSYQQLYEWSITHKEDFWEYALSCVDIEFDVTPQQMLGNPVDDEHPAWLQGARLNITDSIFNNGPDKIAILESDEVTGNINKFTYHELDEIAASVANGLVKANYKKGDRIGIFMPLSFFSIGIYLGIVKAGMVVVSVAESFSASELTSRMMLAKAKAVFTIDQYQYGGKSLDIYSKTQALDIPCIVHKTKVTSLKKSDLSLDDFTAPGEFKPVSCDPYEVTNILFSSGTTNEPKMIPWTHLTPIKSAVDGYFHQDIQSHDVVTWTTGMGWMMAPWLIYAGLINGASIAIWQGAMSGPDYAQFLETAKVTILGTIPSLVASWKKSGVLENRDLKIRLFSSTGEPSNEEAYCYLMYLMGFKAPVIEYCGGTEIGGGYITGAVSQPCIPATFSTPALGSDFVLLDENGKESIEGQVFLKPPSLGLSETLLNRDHHQEYYSHSFGKGLRKHGDAFRAYKDIDEESTYYRCLGRSDDTMNIGGIKVSSVEIESVLNKSELIKESAAISYRSTETGPERLAVFVVLTGRKLDEAEVKQQLNVRIGQELNPLFRITTLQILETLPRTASNKIMRRMLRNRV